MKIDPDHVGLHNEGTALERLGKASEAVDTKVGHSIDPPYSGRSVNKEFVSY